MLKKELIKKFKNLYIMKIIFFLNIYKCKKKNLGNLKEQGKLY